MKQLFIVANWKSNKTSIQVQEWFEKFALYKNQLTGKPQKTMVVCVPFTYLPLAKKFIEKYNLPVHLGAQDLSSFGEGAYTGAINSKQLGEYVGFTIIGHSERRLCFHETDEEIVKKQRIASESGIKTILCVQSAQTQVAEGAEIIAYEPVSAIGTGNPDTPENAASVAKNFLSKNIPFVLYGGSVTPENVKQFTAKDEISGVLVGGASLDPETFFQIINNS